jgi:hypothetical protein
LPLFFVANALARRYVKGIVGPDRPVPAAADAAAATDS